MPALLPGKTHLFGDDFLEELALLFAQPRSEVFKSAFAGRGGGGCCPPNNGTLGLRRASPCRKFHSCDTQRSSDSLHALWDFAPLLAGKKKSIPPAPLTRTAADCSEADCWPTAFRVAVEGDERVRRQAVARMSSCVRSVTTRFADKSALSTAH